MAKIGINLSTGSLQQTEMIVGIDLGTTNSLIAIIHPDTRKPTILKEYDATSLVPSIVHFEKGGVISVGAKAREFQITDPQNTIFSVKRLMGKSYGDVAQFSGMLGYNVIDDGSDDLVKIEVEGKFYTPVELSSFILKALKDRAEHILKTPVTKAVITVPAYFNDAQRQATRDAGKWAGLDVLRIVNEPTAASLAYGMGISPEEKTVAVYDLGGGTFDVSIMRITNGVFEVLSTNGDTYLGGDDMDAAIVAHWIKELGLTQEQLTQKSLAQTLRLQAERAKKQLSTTEAYESSIMEKAVRLTREQFETLVQPLVDRTIASCKLALKDAGVGISDIEEVIMVGGATRVPLVKKSVGQFFNRPVHDDLNPDEVVALGAAIQADILAGNNKEILLLDVTPLSLGIETMGGLMDVLIPRNSRIPTRAGRQYTTQKDGQGSMRISVFQGERDMVKDNRKLAEFNLSGIPGMPAGFPKVELSFLINADGILQVTAKELRSGVAQSVEVKPQYGLTDAAVEQMLMDSITHAKEDIANRSLVEAQTEGRIMLETTQSFLDKNSNFLSAEELKDTTEAMTGLNNKIITGTKDEVQAAIEHLNNISKPYAERVMDISVKAALVHKSIK